MKKFALIAVILFIVPTITLAATAASTNPCSGANSNLPRCINQVYIWSMGIAAFLALVMIVLGGYITLTARGNAQQASRGKNFIVSSIAGLILLFGAYILLRTINPDLVDFNGSCAVDFNRCFNPPPTTPTTPTTPGT